MEIEIDLAADDAEEVRVVTTVIEPRRRWNLRDIQFDLESRNITVRFYGAVGGKVVHKSRILSIADDSNFWVEHGQQIRAFLKKVLDELRITEVE